MTSLIKGKKRTRDLNKAELVTLLEVAGHSGVKGNKTRLQQKCEMLGIETKSDRGYCIGRLEVETKRFTPDPF